MRAPPGYSSSVIFSLRLICQLDLVVCPFTKTRSSLIIFCRKEREYPGKRSCRYLSNRRGLPGCRSPTENSNRSRLPSFAFGKSYFDFVPGGRYQLGAPFLPTC